MRRLCRPVDLVVYLAEDCGSAGSAVLAVAEVVLALDSSCLVDGLLFFFFLLSFFLAKSLDMMPPFLALLFVTSDVVGYFSGVITFETSFSDYFSID